MNFVKIATVDAFAGKRFLKFKLLGRHMAIFREAEGGYFATEISCKHQNWDLTTGSFDGDMVTCPRHGWKYDIRTGQCVNHESTPLRRYHLRVDGDDIYVSLTPVSEGETNDVS